MPRPLIVTAARGNRACTPNALPVRRWHARQWQTEMRTGSPVVVTCSWPQLQHAERTFCPACGATVYYELELLPGFIGIPVGAFADPGCTTPQVSIYEEHQHSWVTLSPDIVHES